MSAEQWKEFIAEIERARVERRAKSDAERRRRQARDEKPKEEYL